MKAVILAAGLGTRMQRTFPLTPKSMLTVGGKPLIQDQIEYLKKFGIRDFYINLHFLPEKMNPSPLQAAGYPASGTSSYRTILPRSRASRYSGSIIKNFLEDGSKLGVNITYSFERELLGTSGALNNFKKKLDQTFVVLYGDIFTRVDIGTFLKFHKDKKSQATLLIHQTDHPEDSDLISINENSQVDNIYTSPHSIPVTNTNFSSAGIYILEPTILQFLPDGFSDFLEDFFPILFKKSVNIYGYLSNEYSKDIGTPKRYEKVQQDIMKLNL